MRFTPITAGSEGSTGTGPFGRLVLRGVTVVDGTGGPPYGPADVVIERDRISAIVSAGRNTDMSQLGLRTGTADEVLDLPGYYVLPGLVDAHAHIGWAEQGPDADYIYRLWLGHGITSVREPGSLGNGLGFTVREAERAARGEITAPRIVGYVAFGSGTSEPIRTEREARAWVAEQAENGAKGIKFFGAAPELFAAALEEANTLGLGSACHHAQSDVARANALHTARWGLGSIEHGYGLPEAMFTDRRIQRFPGDYNYNDEHDRFAYLGRLWREAAEPGSRMWEETIEELVSLGTAIDPTLVVYVAARDAARARGREYHRDYSAPQSWKFFQPDPESHGSFFFDWGTEEEVAWRENYRLWMAFVRDFHLRGGLLTTGSDAGFIYNLYGFGLIEELELLREAGLHPLEIIRCATANGARLLGLPETGTIEPGKTADLLVCAENPLTNLKLLYGHGHLRAGANGAERVGGVTHTIAGGVLHDAVALRARVREQVAAERERLGTGVPRTP
ncbi:amidohydrolase family protein [Sciscionella sediminilitoris]|uniref:amidohydrolase family protein n=1 Tax=Sciscionella sediminilitoris TaxID=1445613 RepID=UPI0004DF8716|nr:amidohydrolase family protein [Sciscionella sp. SE31]